MRVAIGEGGDGALRPRRRAHRRARLPVRFLVFRAAFSYAPTRDKGRRHRRPIARRYGDYGLPLGEAPFLVQAMLETYLSPSLPMRKYYQASSDAMRRRPTQAAHDRSLQGSWSSSSASLLLSASPCSPTALTAGVWLQLTAKPDFVKALYRPCKAGGMGGQGEKVSQGLHKALNGLIRPLQAL